MSGTGKYALGCDLIAPDGYGEIIGGGQREENVEVLKRRIDLRAILLSQSAPSEEVSSGVCEFVRAPGGIVLRRCDNGSYRLEVSP